MLVGNKYTKSNNVSSLVNYHLFLFYNCYCHQFNCIICCEIFSNVKGLHKDSVLHSTHSAANDLFLVLFLIISLVLCLEIQKSYLLAITAYVFILIIHLEFFIMYNYTMTLLNELFICYFRCNRLLRRTRLKKGEIYKRDSHTRR